MNRHGVINLICPLVLLVLIYDNIGSDSLAEVVPDLPRGEPRGFAREGSWLEDVGLPHGGISCRTHRQAALGQVFTPEPAI